MESMPGEEKYLPTGVIPVKQKLELSVRTVRVLFLRVHRRTGDLEVALV
jgi:hypothetical protein